MHSPPYIERQSLAWLIRSRLDKGFTPVEARAFVHMLLVTEAIYSERPLPPGWRLVSMGHDRLMIETADSLEDARHFRFYYAPAPKPLLPPGPEQGPPAAPVQDDTPQTAAPVPDAPPADEGPPTAKGREKAEAAGRKAITDKRRADAMACLLPPLRQALRKRPGKKPKPKDFKSACMKETGLNDYEFDRITWPDALVVVGLKPAKAAAKKRTQK